MHNLKTYIVILLLTVTSVMAGNSYPVSYDTNTGAIVYGNTNGPQTITNAVFGGDVTAVGLVVGGVRSTNIAPVVTNIDSSVSSITNTLPAPSTYVILYNKTNSLNALVLIYGSTTQTIYGTALIKCYPDIANMNWVTEY